MKTTLLFAILTAGLNQLGVHQIAELTYLVAAALALTYGAPAIVRSAVTVRRQHDSTDVVTRVAPSI